MAEAGAGDVNRNEAEKTVVDRTLKLRLSPSAAGVNTPSYVQDHILPEVEWVHRLCGTSLISSATRLLRMSASTYASACAIFHRFYHRVSLAKSDVWSVAMASVLLAGKIEEDPRRLREIILVFSHLYRRRRLQIGVSETNKLASNSNANGNGNGTADSNPPASGKTIRPMCSDLVSKLTEPERNNILRHMKPMSPHGPVYAEWHDALVSTENRILRELGFVLYWIPDSHPHKFLLYFVRVLDIHDKQVRWLGSNNNEHFSVSRLPDFQLPLLK
jgi:hypothetical protein